MPASRFLPSSESRNLPSASTRRTTSSKIVLAFERKHGVDEIMPRALLAQLHLQAVGEERRADRRRAFADLAERQNARLLSRRMRMTPSAARRSAYGSFEPVGFSSMAQKPVENVELVGERHCNRHRIGRHAIGRALRLVVLFDRGGDALVLALRQRVVAAHQALHFGEFTDDFGEQISLGELRRALDLGDIGADQRREFNRELFDTRHTLAPACRAFRGTRSARTCGSRSSSFVFRSVS